MKITKYNSTNGEAIFKTIRVDYGDNKRLELTYSALIRKEDTWRNQDGTKCKYFQISNFNKVKQSGIYINRVALVLLRGTSRE